MLEEQTLKLIQVEEVPAFEAEAPNPERVPAEDNFKIVQEVFLKPLLEAVFARLEQKQALEKKRKTWNKIREEEKKKEEVVKRSKWAYKEPEQTMAEKLALLFQQEEAKIEQDLEVPHVPVKIALGQCFFKVVNAQYELVNRCVLHMLTRKFGLIQHLESLKKVFLCS